MVRRWGGGGVVVAIYTVYPFHFFHLSFFSFVDWYERLLSPH